MKAVILVGGEGTRLRPLTCNTPKAMVPILNRPFLEHMIAYLKKHHFDDIILAMGYRADPIQQYLGDGGDFGVRLTYMVESKPLGTAGAVKNAEKYIEGTFAVFNGDIFTDLDLTAMIAFHQEKGARVTIALIPVEDPTIYGVVEAGADGKVQRFIEKPSWDAVTTNMINAGAYILAPEVLRHIPPNTHYMFEHGLFPSLLEMGAPVYGYPSNGYWLDMGTPEKYLQLHYDLLEGKMPLQFPGTPLHGDIWIEEGCNIHPTARITGPVVIGKNCVIGENVRIIGPTILGQGCSIGTATIIEKAILWAEVHVGVGVMLRRCVIANNSCVYDNARVTDGSILGDHVIVGSGNKLGHGVKVWPGEVILVGVSVMKGIKKT